MTTVLVVAAVAVCWTVAATALGLLIGAASRLGQAHRLHPEVVVPDHVPAEWVHA